MSFLTPAFLAGLLALAVPVFIHLTHRERKQVVAFPSLMFLQRIPYQSMRRQRIRHWLLFALRCLAIALLVAAFARPFLKAPPSRQGAAGLGARELVVLIDRSYSMGYGDRWTRALAAARNAIEGVATADRATIVWFDDAAAAANQRTGDRATLGAVLATSKPGSGVTRFEPALKIAQRILAESDLPRREVVMISDFQRSGWSGREELQLPAGTTLNRVDLSDARTTNMMVAGIELRRETTGGREQVVVAARLVNRGAEALPGVPAALEINGRVLQSKSVRLEPNGTTTVEFAAVPLPEGSSRATVRAGTDQLAADNQFHFVLARAQAVPVLVVEPPDAPASHGLFLARALGIGDHPSFKLGSRKVGQLSAPDVAGAKLIILNDAGFPGGEIGRRLVEFVENGGGLIVVMGDRAPPRGWPAYAATLLAVPDAAPIDRTADRGGTLGYLDRSHPIFEPFGAPRSGDFSSARFFRYRALRAAPGDAELARFDDGRPAVIARAVGRGRVVVFASGADGVWNDLPLQPVFLPFLHQLARHAAAVADVPAWLTVGQVAAVAEPVRGAAADSAVKAAADAERAGPAVIGPDGQRVTVRSSGGAPSIELAEQGFYEVREGGSRGSMQRLIAANLDLAESDLTPLDPAQLATSVVAPNAGGEAAGVAADVLTPKDQERRQTLWWYLLVTALLMLGAETLLSNRLSRAARLNTARR